MVSLSNPADNATLQAFPNPINAASTISFVLPRSGQASLGLYDAEGKLITTLFSGEIKAGENKKLPLNAGALAKGLYIIRLFSDEKVLTQKIIVNK